MKPADDRILPDELSSELGTRFIGRRLYSYEALDSTNDTAWKLGAEGLPEGVCIFAEFQKKGRGRLGRSWTSPRGKNLLFSILLRPRLSPNEVSKITLTTAVSVVKVIGRFTGKDCGIQWPNDVLFERKKVCGILTEMSTESDRVKFVVVGIGVNVNAAGRELPARATSIKEMTGKAVPRRVFAKKLLEQIESDYLRLKKGLFHEIAREWEDYSVTSGRRVIATVFGRKIQGQASGIDEDGALWIRKDNGLQEKITSGDIEHLWAN